MPPIKNGQSEIDNVVLRLPDAGKEISNWQSYTTTSNFLSPTDTFSFRISAEDTSLYQSILVPGAVVQLVVNDKIQLTGYIDDRTIKYSRRGTEISITGRDTLSRMVNANIDPTFKFKTDMTVGDVVSAAMIPFGFDTLYNSAGTSLNIQTGRTNKESLKVTNSTGQRHVRDSSGNFSGGLQNVTITEIVSNIKPGLYKIPIKEYKAKVNEGAYAYVSRLIKREGLILKASADGAGLMVISPDYDGDINYNLTCKRTVPNQNNVLDGESHLDWSAQPSVIVARGFGGGAEFNKSNLFVVMVNELTGLDESGKPMPEVQNILDIYKKAKLVPIRQELIPSNQNALAKNYSFCPMYITDTDSKDLAQLQNFVIRKMAELQMKGLTLKYTVPGHTDPSSPEVRPWAVNTLVNVDDDINDIHESMWVLERTFTKSRDQGTLTNLTLIRPHTLTIGG